jgi:hypothetical protein
MAALQQNLGGLPQVTQEWLFIGSSPTQRETQGERRTHEWIDKTDDKVQASETERFL